MEHHHRYSGFLLDGRNLVGVHTHREDHLRGHRHDPLEIRQSARPSLADGGQPCSPVRHGQAVRAARRIRAFLLFNGLDPHHRVQPLHIDHEAHGSTQRDDPFHPGRDADLASGHVGDLDHPGASRCCGHNCRAQNGQDQQGHDSGKNQPTCHAITPFSATPMLTTRARSRQSSPGRPFFRPAAGRRVRRSSPRTARRRCRRKGAPFPAGRRTVP